jgi:hypothetical protein
VADVTKKHRREERISAPSAEPKRSEGKAAPSIPFAPTDEIAPIDLTRYGRRAGEIIARAKHPQRRR